MSFFDQLQQGSFRGVPFGVHSGEARFGRRQAVHEYPFRDTPWIEDIGRGTRKISFVAFLIENSRVYGGGPVVGQRESLIAACEMAGSGTLVHPTLGRLTVSVPEDGLVTTERWDEGLYFEIGFTFIESGDRVFPSTASDTPSNSQAAAGVAGGAARTDFVGTVNVNALNSQVQGILAQGSAVVAMAVATVAPFIQTIARLSFDATGLYTTIIELPGDFGRYFASSLSGFAGSAQPVPGAPTTLQGLILAGSASRAAVTQANAALAVASAGTDPEALAEALQASIAALLEATDDPRVAIRLLSALSDFFPSAPTSATPIGIAQGIMQTALGCLARRSALAALVQASALYQPSSRDDAANLRDALCALIDAEILVAGDNGDDASYVALRSMRSAMVIDLNARGAALAPMQTFNFSANMPAPVLAQRIYRDPTRADQLVAEANPPHPAFMPVSFAALAT